MQNFGNYNVNPNTPIYVGGGKKKVKKQSEDKSLGEKVAIGVASTAGAIAAILIGYGIINKFTGNTTKITKDAKEAATAVLPKAKDAGKKLLPPNKSGDQNVRTILKNLNKIKDGSLTYDQAIKMKQSLQVLCKNGSVSDVKLNGIDLAPFFNHLLIYLSTITQNGKDNFKCDTSNKKLLCNEGANFWIRIKTIDNVNKFLGNFQLTDVEVDDKEAKLSLKKNSTIKDISNLNFDQNPKTSDLIELCKGFYISKGDINDDSKLYIKDQEGKFAEITLRQLKENLNPVVTIEHPIEDLNDIKKFEDAKIVNGKKDETTELYLTGLKKDDDDAKIYSIKVSALLANTALLKQLIKNLNIPPEKFADVIKTAEASILNQLLGDDDLKDTLVENKKLTDIGKKIVDAGIKGNDEQEKVKNIVTILKGLDKKKEVGAAVVDYLIDCGNVTAEMLNQLLRSNDLKGTLVENNELTNIGEKIVGAAIKDNGVIASGKIVTMLSGIEDLDTKGSVGAAVVEHLLANTDITEDLLNQLMSNTDLKAKFIGQKGDDKDKLTEVGQKFMKKAIDKHISLKALNGLVKRFGIKDFSYTIPNKKITLTINENSQLLITNYAQYVYDYIKTCGDDGTKVVADVDRLLFRSIVKNKDTYDKYFDQDGKFKDSNGVSFVQDDFKPEYTTQQHKYEDFKSVEYLKNVASNWAACQDQLALNLSALTTLGQVLASQDIQAKLVDQNDGANKGKLTEAGKAIVEAAIVHDTTGLEQNAKDKKQQENIVELLSNFGSFGENTVGAAVINHLMDHKDVTAEMLGQALNDSELKAKFFNEPTSEGTTTYSLTPAGQHMIKQAAKTYNNNNNDNNSFSRFLKNLNVANYFNVIYDILAKNEDNYISSQACWFLQILISDTSVSEEDKKVLHEIIKNKCINDFNLNDHSDTCYTNQNRDLTISGISELILFANSQSNVFIGAAETTTSDVLKNLKKKEFTITINNVKFKYIIDETNHKVYYRQK